MEGRDTTRLRVGLIGYPVSHSRSPAMQQAAFDRLEIAARYELWDTPEEALAARVASLREPGMLGANITIPYKTAVMSLLDEIAPEAQQYAGAVNTIVREETATGARLVGYNTDLLALRRVLRERSVWSGGDLLLLGAGGAARAALGVALLEGTQPWVAARHVVQAEAVLHDLWPLFRARDGLAESARAQWLARALPLDDAKRLGKILPSCAVVINATPIGTLAPDTSPLAPSLLAQLSSGAFVLDMVYNPPVTALVRASRARGLRAESGLAMLLYQGAEAFQLWTGQAAPLDAMRAALEGVE